MPPVFLRRAVGTLSLCFLGECKSAEYQPECDEARASSHKDILRLSHSAGNRTRDRSGLRPYCFCNRVFRRRGADVAGSGIGSPEFIVVLDAF